MFKAILFVCLDLSLKMIQGASRRGAREGAGEAMRGR